jgi:hypothetical protein
LLAIDIPILIGSEVAGTLVIAVVSMPVGSSVTTGSVVAVEQAARLITIIIETNIHIIFFIIFSFFIVYKYVP